MAIPSATVVADRWAAAAGQASQRYADGVAQTDKDPTQLAIQNQAALVNNFNTAVSNGTWARRLGAVGKTGWQQAVAAKGAANYGTGVNAAKGKFQQKIGPVLAFESQLQQQIDAMPNVTSADKTARMVAWKNGMEQAKLNGVFG